MAISITNPTCKKSRVLMLINLFLPFSVIRVLLNLVAYAVDRFKMLFAPFSELGAKARNVRVNRTHVTEVVKSPHVVEQLLAAVNTLGVVDKLFEDFEFLECQINNLTVNPDLVCVGVDCKSPTVIFLGSDELRRSRASTRLTSTAGENGLVT